MIIRSFVTAIGRAQPKLILSLSFNKKKNIFFFFHEKKVLINFIENVTHYFAVKKCLIKYILRILSVLSVC